jgi:medium-chain acyl-[acyl-carrier-protein] hydrolase
MPVAPVSPWARRYAATAGPAALRLLCFHHAGSGASFFRDWRLPERLSAEIWAVQLPGRENRRAEQPFRRIEPAVSALAHELRPLMEQPFAFFGHSMGALISFELARHLRAASIPLPVRLFLSGHRSPNLPARHGPASQLPDAEFLARLDKSAGGSSSAARDPEVLKLLAPLIRADLELCETYTYRDEPPLPVPFSCLSGTADYEADPADVAAWKQHSSHSCLTYFYPGGHFFIRDDPGRVLAAIATDL